MHLLPFLQVLNIDLSLLRELPSVAQMPLLKEATDTSGTRQPKRDNVGVAVWIIYVWDVWLLSFNPEQNFSGGPIHILALPVIVLCPLHKLHLIYVRKANNVHMHRDQPLWKRRSTSMSPLVLQHHHCHQCPQWCVKQTAPDRNADPNTRARCSSTGWRRPCHQTSSSRTWWWALQDTSSSTLHFSSPFCSQRNCGLLMPPSRQWVSHFISCGAYTLLWGRTTVSNKCPCWWCWCLGDQRLTTLHCWSFWGPSSLHLPWELWWTLRLLSGQPSGMSFPQQSPGAAAFIGNKLCGVKWKSLD